MKTAQTALACTAAALLTAGCAQTPTDQSGAQAPISSKPYDGPAVTIESRDDTHRIIIATPTGGYSVIWDGKLESNGRIHLTIRRPNPDFFHVQQIVEHRIDSTVPNDKPLEVLVRVVDHDDRTGTIPFRSAAHTSG